MPILEEMVGHLSPQERKRFRFYLGVQKGSMELKLFDVFCLSPQAEAKDIVNQLYGKTAKRAGYLALRKRLQNRLMAFVVLDQAEQEQEARTLVMHYITVAYKYQRTRAWDTVAHYMTKAEELATEYRMYTLLEGVYNFMIQTAAHTGANLTELLHKQEVNWKRFNHVRELNKVAAEVEIAVNRAKQEGRVLDPTAVMERVKAMHTLTPAEYADPAFRLRILRIFRAALLSAKRYTELEVLVQEAYTDMNQAGTLEGLVTDEQMDLYYIVAHSLYRSKKFEKALHMLDTLQQRLPKDTWITSVALLKARALRAALLAYTGKNTEAIALLEDLRSSRPQEHHMREWLNIDLSLSVYYFQSELYRKTIGVLRDIDLLDIGQEDWMGSEWCFKKDLIATIAHYELGNTDVVQKLHEDIKRKYAALLNSAPYSNAALFVEVCGKVFQNPHITEQEKFRQQVKSVIKDWEFDVGDIQAITFFCWLKSKLHKVPYYELLLSEARGEGAVLENG